MTLNFYLRFSTRFGQTLYLSGSHSALGNDAAALAVPMQYFNDDFWHIQVIIPDAAFTSFEIEYRYILREQDGNEIIEWGNDRIIDFKKTTSKDITLIDTWNHAGEVENAFFTKPFQEVFFKKPPSVKTKTVKNFTHEFRVKAPLLAEDEVLFISGNGQVLNDWNIEKPALLSKEGNWWVARLTLANENFPVVYKYGVFNVVKNVFVRYETGNNRMVTGGNEKGKQTILHDGFAQMPYPSWKGAGVAIPVFSLRTNQSFGTGEFTDMQLLVNWAKGCGLKVIQLLPINDTTATHTWTDSYPYAAISAFALHPLYLNLSKVAGGKNASLIKKLEAKRLELNALPEVDYEAVMKVKFDAIKKIFDLQKDKFKDDLKYFEFFELNRHWLVPYAAFCYLRDKYKTADYNQWKTHSVYDENAIQKLASPTQKHYDAICLHYFIQYHLHLQLKEATAYAHKNGIIVKGDLPIGIYRYGCDAWTAPGLYNMNAQAGAPPDDFAIKGQNWGFPTYNWVKMEEDGYAWWRKRFEQMSEYFDAYRIDHILGFFRIWSIPLHAVEGIMGRFVPAIPVHINELHRNGISFDWHRYCKPYIPDHVVNEIFRGEASYVKEIFLQWMDGAFELKPDFDTQRKIENYFNQLPDSEKNNALKQGLFDLVSNVIFFDEEGSNMQQFHFRINMESTISFRHLDSHSKQKLKEIYINYFFKRQDDFWKKEAMRKLPSLKRSTNMLVCGEDLGMVPECVPDVMRQLGMLSLEIQRMPKDPAKEFFHPGDAPYLSVVTPSTHDMSTIRGWWEEDRTKTQHFYNNMLGHYGPSPFFCEAFLNKEILLQHLYSPAMLCIFQIQDILGISEKLRRENPNDERINVPANPKHYWRYRMHISIEDLIKEDAFNQEFGGFISASKR
jgi:4-alpha-glucanotransferase